MKLKGAKTDMSSSSCNSKDVSTRSVQVVQIDTLETYPLGFAKQTPNEAEEIPPSWKHLKLSLCFFLVLIFFRSQLMPVAALRTGQPYSPQLLSCSTQDKAQPALRPTEPISSAQVFSRWLYLADTMQFLKNKRFTIPLIPITRALCVPRKEVFLKAWQIRHAQSMRD